MPTIIETARRLAAGGTTSVGLIEVALARAEDPAGEGNRTYTKLFAAAARAQAEASDKLRSRGIVPSPLAGIPISIKDLFDVQGQVTTAGSASFPNAPPATEDAAIVRRLYGAGAVITGRTNMPEFACCGLGLNRHFGTPRNVWDRATGRIPGGSSSGAAISVTDGMAIAAIGTDTGGSVRIPAALNGIVGFKPTQRRVPLDGCKPLSFSLDSIGPLAHSVACCALIDGVLSGEGAAVPDAIPLNRLSLAVPRRTFLFDDLDEPVARAFERALTTLSAAGARIGEVDFPGFTPADGGLAAKMSYIQAESYSLYRAHFAEHQNECDPRILAKILPGAKILAADYIEMAARRRRSIATIERALTGFNGWLAPTVPGIAPPIAIFDTDDTVYHTLTQRLTRNTSPVNLLDGCALSIPCHEPGTAPVGLMLAGVAGADRQILAAGLSVEAALARR